VREGADRNPEGAAPRGKWADLDFLRNVSERINPTLKDTQFADYHGHGWNFRAVFKRDRKGNLLDADGNIVVPDDRQGMTTRAEVPARPCTCRRSTPTSACTASTATSRRTATATATSTARSPRRVEIDCKDCHGTADAYPTLRTSGPAAPRRGTTSRCCATPTAAALRVGGRQALQRSIVDPPRMGGVAW
jgi:hypothetical protein